VTQKGDTAEPCGGTTVAGGAIGGPFELVDETGRTVTDADVITEPTLIYFGYTFCPDVCPLDSARNAAAVDILAEQGISATPLFISIDPARDTVDVVREYTDNFHPKMIGLTGSDAQVAAASQAYRTVYSKQDDDPEYYLMQHSTFTYLVMPDVGFVDFFRLENSPEEVASRAACFVDAS
jgi:protein SCO1/2